ncbi:LOW QUALITY PROTEIN: hypothetical protein HID58_037785, partial [Brassica napus]
MLNRDDPKVKEDSSSNVGGEEMTMNPEKQVGMKRTHHRQICRPRDQAKSQDADESEENASEKEEEKESKSGRGGIKKSRRTQRRRRREGSRRRRKGIREHETESHAEELLAFETIPNLRNHFRDSVNSARSGCPRMCKLQYKRKGGTKAFNLNAVNVNLGDTQVEGPIIPAIEDSVEAHADSVEAPGVEALKAMEDRLMNAISDGMKEVNKKVKSLYNRLALVENKVKSLKVSVLGMSELPSEGESDNPSDQDGSDNPSEEDGGDNPSEEEGGDTPLEEEDGGSKDDNVFAIANQVQSEHGNGDDDMNDTAEMAVAAEQLESQMQTLRRRKRRGREDNGNELLPSKKPKGCDKVRRPIWTRGQKMEEAPAQKEAAQKKAIKEKAGEKKQKKEAAAEKEAVQKKASKKKKTKK